MISEERRRAIDDCIAAIDAKANEFAAAVLQAKSNRQPNSEIRELACMNAAALMCSMELLSILIKEDVE